jgi:hypothetical protein
MIPLIPFWYPVWERNSRPSDQAATLGKSAASGSLFLVWRLSIFNNHQPNIFSGCEA